MSRHEGDNTWKSFSENTSTTSAAAAKSSRSPTATRATTCCRASWPWRSPKRNKRQIERERAAAEARDLEEKAQAEAFGQRLSQTEVEIARRVGENNTLYGSVTSADIAQALLAKGFEIDKRKIQLPEPIKALGELTVPVKVHREVTAQVKVKVVAEKR